MQSRCILEIEKTKKRSKELVARVDKEIDNR